VNQPNGVQEHYIRDSEYNSELASLFVSLLLLMNCAICASLCFFLCLFICDICSNVSFSNKKSRTHCRTGSVFIFGLSPQSVVPREEGLLGP
jgi:hypothetical protein